LNFLKGTQFIAPFGLKKTRNRHNLPSDLLDKPLISNIGVIFSGTLSNPPYLPKTVEEMLNYDAKIRTQEKSPRVENTAHGSG
jgi:hypothetical protein